MLFIVRDVLGLDQQMIITELPAPKYWEMLCFAGCSQTQIVLGVKTWMILAVKPKTVAPGQTL